MTMNATLKTKIILYLSIWSICASSVLYAQTQHAQIQRQTDINFIPTSVPGDPLDTQPAIPTHPIAADLYYRLQKTPARKLKANEIALMSPELIQRFYTQRRFQPAWLNAKGKPLRLAGDLLKALDQAEHEGLRAWLYHSEAIRQNLRSLTMAFAPSVRQQADFDLLLSDAFLSYGLHVSTGRLDPKTVDADWSRRSPPFDMAYMLENALQQKSIGATLAKLSPTSPRYTQLRTALKHYRELAKQGGWLSIDHGRKLTPGKSDPRIVQLRARLAVTKDYDPELFPPVDELFYDDALVAAVESFQSRHGLKADGVVGKQTLTALNIPISQRIQQIELNMERLRWLPADLGQRHIVVNIPDYAMSVIEYGREVLKSRAIVGRSKRPTPVFSAAMEYIVVSPYWYVPPTIALEDKLPLLRKNPYALRKQRIRIFSGGRRVDPGQINWHAVNENNFRYTLRQDPGPRNALGDIKFMFPNRHSVYIHDTPTQRLFKRNRRTFSSGCIRIDTPYELAEYLLQDDPQWSHDSLLSKVKKRREHRVDLPTAIPVHLLYWTAWIERDGSIHFRNDIYDRDIALAAALYSV